MGPDSQLEARGSWLSNRAIDQLPDPIRILSRNSNVTEFKSNSYTVTGLGPNSGSVQACVSMLIVVKWR